MITLLTTSPKFNVSKEIIGHYAKKLLRKKRGPDAVTDSLIRGLKELHISYEFNPRKIHSKTVHVLNGVEALRYAIKLKKKGRIDYLIAGPNIVVMPKDKNSILLSPHIDAILVPSEWIKKFYGTDSPEISSKLHVWPSGVNVPELSEKKRAGYIVYKKEIDETVYQNVVEILTQKNIDFRIFTYGSFNQKEYFDYLSHVEGMIYLQNVESQGMALQEAWIRNVPTFAFYSGSFTYPNGYVAKGNVSAPYLTDECGSFFKKNDNFAEAFDIFQNNLQSFIPREYCKKELSDEASARKYASIIATIKNNR